MRYIYILGITRSQFAQPEPKKTAHGDPSCEIRGDREDLELSATPGGSCWVY